MSKRKAASSKVQQLEELLAKQLEQRLNVSPAVELLESWVELARGGAFGEDYMREGPTGCDRTCSSPGDSCVVCSTERYLQYFGKKPPQTDGAPTDF